MSNLYKGFYTATETGAPRVIDSNQIMERRMEELQREAEAERLRAEREERLARLEEAETSGDGFSEGLLAEDVTELAREQSEQIFEEAEAKTEQMLAEAREQAEGILANARLEAEQLKTQAKTRGYEEGTAQAREEAEKERIRRDQEYEERARLLEETYEKEMLELEPELLNVILEVFNRVFHIQFDDKKEILGYLVTNTIKHVEGCRDFRIHAGEDGYPYLTSSLKDIQAQVGAEYHMEVVMDANLQENQCIIETDGGMFDCSLGVYLENLMKDLKSLCP